MVLFCFNINSYPERITGWSLRFPCNTRSSSFSKAPQNEMFSKMILQPGNNISFNQSWPKTLYLSLSQGPRCNHCYRYNLRFSWWDRGRLPRDNRFGEMLQIPQSFHQPVLPQAWYTCCQDGASTSTCGECDQGDRDSFTVSQLTYLVSAKFSCSCVKVMN